MVSGAAARDRFYRKIQPLVGDEEAEWLMGRLSEDEVTDLATKDFVRQEIRELRAEMRTEFAETRAEMTELRAELRATMSSFVTREELSEQLRLHVDARIGALGRSWMFATMGMQAATIAGVIAAVRL